MYLFTCPLAHFAFVRFLCVCVEAMTLYFITYLFFRV